MPSSWAVFAIEATLAVDEQARRASLARSVKELERALELRPEWVNRLADLAVVEYRQGNRDRAFGLIHRALELDPANPTAYRARAYLYTREAEVSEAAGDERAARDHRALAAQAAKSAEATRRREEEP